MSLLSQLSKNQKKETFFICILFLFYIIFELFKPEQNYNKKTITKMFDRIVI